MLTAFRKLCELQRHMAAHLLYLLTPKKKKKTWKNAAPSVTFIAKKLLQTGNYSRYRHYYDDYNYERVSRPSNCTYNV